MKSLRYCSRGNGLQTFKNSTNSQLCDWSVENHERLTEEKHHLLKRQFTCLPVTQVSGGASAPRRGEVSFFQQNCHLYDEQICRVYLPSEEFQLISQQMDVEFLLFKLLADQRIAERVHLRREGNKTELVFVSRYQLIPFCFQLVFYDKYLQCYSVHHYQLQGVSKNIEFLPEIKPEVSSSEEMIQRQGILQTVRRVRNRRLPILNQDYYSRMTRVIKPMLTINRLHYPEVNDMIDKFKHSLI